MSLSKEKIAIEDVPRSVEWTDDERAEIVRETNRILEDSAFRNSKRCVALFRCLVDRSLAGGHEGIKERTLGVEVFGRSPDYDTAVDPVVRITANEIRKRLAQWYQEPAHHQRVRVRLLAGAYLLNFEFVQQGQLPQIPKPDSGAVTSEATLVLLPEPLCEPQTVGHSVAPTITKTENSLEDVAVPTAPVAPSQSQNRRFWGAAVTVAFALAVTLILLHLDIFQTRDSQVWKPLLGSAQPLTLSIADAQPIVVPDGSTNWQVIADAIANRVAPADPATGIGTNVNAPLADAEASVSIAGWLAMHGQRSALRGSSSVTLRDLREGPVVLVGGFNPWSLILLSNLRYSIRVDPVTHAEWIQDAKNPSNRDWIIKNNFEPRDVDYAVISRFIDTETGHWILAMGGLRSQGTQAATELLTDSALSQQIPSQIRSTGNFQIVLKTNFINGGAGPPQILAVHTW